MLIEEYSWVLKVLESCETKTQVKSAENLFSIFLIKWKEDISDFIKQSYISLFDRIKKTTLYKIEKNVSTNQI
jgi:hypothetical protein